MQVSKIIGLVLWLGGWLAANAVALTFQYTDGATFTGDIVQKQPAYLQVRIDSGYTNLDWSKFSQETLKELKTLAASNRDQKLDEYVSPYIEVSQDEIVKKTEVVIKPVPRLERPAKGSLVGALFKSSVGIFCLLLLYGANIYAGYEISCVRAYPAALVCGVAALVPIIGPVIFLCLPTNLPSRPGEAAEHPAAAEASHSASYSPTPDGPGAAEATADHAAGHAAPAAVPETQVFKRGQYTFNRRFIETKFAAFFGAVRRGAEKDLVLVIKSGRSEYLATRISRIAASDMHVEVARGGAPQEVQVPFADIQEMQIKHQDA